VTSKTAAAGDGSGAAGLGAALLRRPETGRGRSGRRLQARLGRASWRRLAGRRGATGGLPAAGTGVLAAARRAPG
jgi:hypothetical protein